MRLLHLEGQDSLEISENKIELLPMIQLLRQPFFVDADIEEVYKHGGEFYRELIDQTPLRNDKKYVSVVALVQYLTPITSSIPNNDWHCDPGVDNPYNQDASLHILMNSVTARTEFLDSSLTVEAPDYYTQWGHREFRRFIDNNIELSGIKPFKSPSNHMLTFTNKHPHRAVLSKSDEFRFFWRVQESDVEKPKENGRTKTSTVIRLTDRKGIPSIEQEDNWIIVRDMVEMY